MLCWAVYRIGGSREMSGTNCAERALSVVMCRVVSLSLSRKPRQVPVLQRSDNLMTNPLSRVLGLILAVAAVSSVSAQGGGSNTPSNQELANARAMIQEGRETIIREDLRMTADEEAAFWPLYEDYRSDMMPIQDRYVALIADYVRQYESGALTDEYAEEMLDSYFDIKSDLLRKRKKYVRQFRKVLPMLKVARFYQLENKMNATIDAELALVVPLLESN